MKESIIYNKALDYAVRIVNLYKYLIGTKKETIMITSENRDGRDWLGGDNIEEFLSTSHPELASEVKFVDNGIGIPEKDLEDKVFKTILSVVDFIRNNDISIN